MSMRDLDLSWNPRRKPAWTPALPVPRPPGGGLPALLVRRPQLAVRSGPL